MTYPTEIVEEVLKRLKERLGTSCLSLEPLCERRIPIEASGRHVHLSPSHAKILFGGTLTPKRDLSQTGEYLCHERVLLVGENEVLKNVAVLGPYREKTQVEVSLSDARRLGIQPPLRDSGELLGAATIVLLAGGAMVKAENAVILPRPHLHVPLADAIFFGVQDKDCVSVRVKGLKSLVLEGVRVRVHPNYTLALHIDYDEANAIGLQEDSYGELLRTKG